MQSISISEAFAAETPNSGPLVPIENFSALPFLHSPVLSPNGKKIAVLVNKDEEKLIGIIDLTAPAGSDLKYYSLGKRGLNWFLWAGNDQLLLSSGDWNFLIYSVYSTSSLKRLDLRTSKVIELNTRSKLSRDHVIFIDPAGRFIISHQRRRPLQSPHAIRINLTDGSEVVVEKPSHNIDRWLADPAGNIRAGIAYSEKKWRVFYRDKPGENLEKIAIKRRDIFEGDVVEEIYLLGGTDRSIIIANSKTGRFGAYNYDIRTDAFGDTVYEHPTADVTDVVLDNAGKPIGVRFEAEKPGQKWFEPDLEKIQKNIDKNFKNKQNRILSTSTYKDVVMFWSGSASDPGSYYLYYPTENKIEQILIPFDKIDPVKMAEVKTVNYQARDGLTIPAYLTLPKGSDGKNLPTIILPHGGPFARSSWAFHDWVQFLANRGYAVLQPNFRGSTGFGRDYVEKGYGQWGTGMIEDIDDGTQWMIDQAIADKDRICIMGASYGGYAALWSAMKYPERYQCSISLNGVTDVKAMWKYDRKLFSAKRYFKDWQKQKIGLEKEELVAISPVQHAAKMQIPVLVAQGVKDVRVPKKHADDLIEAWDVVGFTQYEKIYFPKSGHGFDNSEDATAFLKKVEAFLAKHNPTTVNVPKPEVAAAEAAAD